MEPTVKMTARIFAFFLLAAFVLLQTSAVATSESLVVHAGAADTRLGQQIAANHANSVVQVLLRTSVMDAREDLRSKKLLGKVFADSWDASRLPQADSSVNLLIAESPVDTDELHRVLAPGGTALLKVGGRWKTITGPRPGTIDDWTHYLYDTSNNPVSKDTTVAAPKHLQWWAPPKYSRSHETEDSVPAMVSAGGRVVYIVDEGLTGITDPRLPQTWALIARDAFSGVTLWRIELPEWGWPQWNPERANKPFNTQD